MICTVSAQGRTARSGSARRAALVAVCLGLLLGAGVPGSAAAPGADPGWGPAQEVPPVDGEHGLPLTAVFPDGTLVAVWAEDHTGPREDTTRIYRTTRPRGGTWSEPELFPADVAFQGLDDVVTRPDGSLVITYRGPEPTDSTLRHRVRTWSADGTVGPVGPANYSEDYSLSADAAGDVLASRLGRYHVETGDFDWSLRYGDENRWRRLPNLRADPGDQFAPGPGDSVWMAGYDQDRRVLRVRRWTPRSGTWKVQWSRDYPKSHRRLPPVVGFDLAVSATGRVILAFDAGGTIRAVERARRSTWSRPVLLHRPPAGQSELLTKPVVAIAGAHAEVAWTAPAPTGGRVREVRIARLGRAGPDVRRLAVAPFSKGLRGLSLDLDVRDDGNVLVTYVQRRDDVRDLVGWLGPHADLSPTTLVENVGGMLGDSAFLVPGVAGVVHTVRGGGLVSRVSED